MMIQPNTDMTGTGSDSVGIVMLIVTFDATKSVQTIYHVTVNAVKVFDPMMCKSPDVLFTRRAAVLIICSKFDMWPT